MSTPEKTMFTIWQRLSPKGLVHVFATSTEQTYLWADPPIRLGEILALDPESAVKEWHVQQSAVEWAAFSIFWTTYQVQDKTHLDRIALDGWRAGRETMRQELAPQAPPVEQMAWPELSVEELSALLRFCETCEDGQGYDVSKPMMHALAAIGVVQHMSAGIYAITAFGEAVVEKAGQPAQAFMAREMQSILNTPIPHELG